MRSSCSSSQLARTRHPRRIQYRNPLVRHRSPPAPARRVRERQSSGARAVRRIPRSDPACTGYVFVPVRVGLTLLTIALLSTLRGPVSLVGFLDGCLTYSALLRRHPPTVPPAHPPTYLAHMPLSSTFSLTHLSPRHHHALNNHHIFQFNSTLSGHRSPPSHLRPTYRDLHRLLPRQQAYRKPTTGTASEEVVRKTIEGARELQYEWAAGIPVSGIAYQLLEQHQLRSGAKPS